MAFGLLVVPMTMTRPRPVLADSSSIPSSIVSRVATTLFSTSPPGPSSRLGAIASISSKTTIQGLFSRASSNTSRSRASVSPW